MSTLSRFALVLLLCGYTGCAIYVVEGEVKTIRPGAGYDALFPRYVELCAVSQIRANFTGHGGSPGHAAMYVKGACRDDSSPYPLLKACDADVDLSSPEAGMGVSVNKMLSNVNWLGVPGKQLFFYGNVEEGELLNVERGKAAVYAAAAAGVFSGVELHGDYLPPEDDEAARLYLAAAETLGTDFALNFGRTVFCLRLPMGEAELADTMGYLNDLNREYATGEADYNWSGYADNCSHTLHNSLAAAGVWSHKGVNLFRLAQMANLSVPANEFVDLSILATTYPIEDFDKLYADPVLRRSLLERGWLPARHGALLKRIATHEPNELYDTEARIFMLQNPLRRSKAARVRELFSDPRYTVLEANLEHFRGRYAAILAARPTLAPELAQGSDAEREAARLAYYDYIEAQLADVDAKLAQLASTSH